MVPEQVAGVRIVFDDDDIVVVDKPVGVAAHPSLGWDGPSVLGHLAGAGLPDLHLGRAGAARDRAAARRRDLGADGGGQERAGVHGAQARLQGADGRKTYHTLVQGHPDPFTGTIEAPIGRHPGADYKMAVLAGGRHSVTHYATLEAFVGATLLEVRLETGRTHQIRVHMAAIRHPCVGDPTYGADPVLAARLGLERQWLHAVRLGFTHPASGDEVVFTSDYPDDLRHALEIVRAA